MSDIFRRSIRNFEDIFSTVRYIQTFYIFRHIRYIYFFIVIKNIITFEKNLKMNI